MPRKPKPRVGRPPVAGETATERIEIRLTPTQTKEWLRLMRDRECASLKELIVEAMDKLAETDEEREEEGRLADLAREVIALVNQNPS